MLRARLPPLLGEMELSPCFRRPLNPNNRKLQALAATMRPRSAGALRWGLLPIWVIRYFEHTIPGADTRAVGIALKAV
jgi:hypothetical protein